MADTTVLTCTEKTESRNGSLANGMNGVCTRTFTFPVVASGTGYGDTDIWDTITLPANVQILSIATKSSVEQTNNTTVAWSITAGTFADAQIPGNTIFKAHTLTEDNTCTGASDEYLIGTLGTGTCVAGTITVTLTYVPLGANVSSQTTYTI